MWPAVGNAQPDDEGDAAEAAEEPEATDDDWGESAAPAPAAPLPDSPYGTAAGASEQPADELAQLKAQLAQAVAETKEAKKELAEAKKELEDEEAEEQEAIAGAYRHDGMMFRVNFGAGVGSLWSKGEAYQWPGRFSVSPGGYQSLAFGGAVTDNLLLHGDLHAFVDVGRSEQTDPLRITGLLGFGASYYFMPANVYLSGTVGPAMAVVSYDRQRYVETDRSRFTGIGGVLNLGKEWWVHRSWGVGMAAGLLYTYTAEWTDRDQSQKLHSLATMLSLTATYN
jgi:hypothetical protein